MANDIVKKLEKELKDLEKKIDKIRYVIFASDEERGERGINGLQADLIFAQYYAMESYAEILRIRISELERGICDD